MTLQEEDRLRNKPTSDAEGFGNAMVDNIVHNKVQAFTYQMGTFYQAPTKEK